MGRFDREHGGPSHFYDRAALPTLAVHTHHIELQYRSRIHPNLNPNTRSDDMKGTSVSTAPRRQVEIQEQKSLINSIHVPRSG
ncbi:hypothetical protein PILCRDRAFT_821755 [Piloderma croceum F 1598]|uniref:Uncharacterized protein n=1 Tax=Piloderma croceum (strain F 1598) TaxID=765440 RepID=A0A0C3BVA3_PILCF|nr:hypothetical protein PILCRDRAFT_821755 [Piloderma croceum F 1598]